MNHLDSIFNAILSVGFGEFMRDLDLSWVGVFNEISELSEYYIYRYGWSAVAGLIIVVYIALMTWGPTRPLATLMLNTIFRQPFDLARDLLKGVSAVFFASLKYIGSSIRSSRSNDE